MIFTVYYMYATILQWWRLGALKNKIYGTLNSHNALLICAGSTVYETKKQRCLENLLFHHEDRIGCTIVPKQKVNLSVWVPFPNDYKFFPIYFSEHRPKVNYPALYVLVQAVLENYTKHHSEVIQVENFGELIAWRASENFELLLKTDIENLTKLVHCFSQNSVDINHDLKVLKIETVDIEGNITKIKYDKRYLLEQKLKYSYAPVHWKTFVSEVKQLYSKIHDTTNPKITIENGCSKADAAKKVPVSEVKPIKKDGKKGAEDKHTLDVGSGDHRRHKTVEHRREKTPEEKRKTKDDHMKNKKVETAGKSSLNEGTSDSVQKANDVTMPKNSERADKSSKPSKSDSKQDTLQSSKSSVLSKSPPKSSEEKSESKTVKKNETHLLLNTQKLSKSPPSDSKNASGDVLNSKLQTGIDSKTNILKSKSPERSSNISKSPGTSPKASPRTSPKTSPKKPKDSTATVSTSKPQSSKEANGMTSKCLIASVLSKTKESCKFKDKDKKDKAKSEDKVKVCEKAKQPEDKAKDKDKKGKSKETKSRDSSKENGEACSRSKERDKKELKANEDDKKGAKSRESSKEKETKGKVDDKKGAKSRDSSKEGKSKDDDKKDTKTKETEGKVKERRRFEVRLGGRDKLSKSKSLSEASTSESKPEAQKNVEPPTVKKGVCESSSMIDMTHKSDDSRTKPPNILVYADSLVAKENVKSVLQTIINKQKYTVYDLPVNTQNVSWNASTTLIVICGSVPPSLTSHILQYLVNGGHLLCLCSDLLYSVLHTFTTAEVREHELVRFSYGEWRRVKMMHHIFCYQASPAKKQFSRDSDHSNQSSNGSSPIAPRTPSTVDIQHNGKDYTIQVQVLGAEETWQTPSLLLASVKNTNGKAIFSQVHLEIDPTQYEDDENKYEALKDSNQARLEIFRDILGTHLNIDCSSVGDSIYTPGYFLGRHELKLEMLSNCENIKDSLLSTPNVDVVFHRKNEELGIINENRLPVLIHSCPSNFSTVQYFETLETNDIGRLVLYCDVLSSSQYVISKKLKHGFVVIPRQQTHAMGRSNNSWLSPLGSASFSLQMQIPIESSLGRSLPLVQHLIMVAVVAAIKQMPGYENLEIGIKWPNDLYANSSVKIGGLVVSSILEAATAIVNIGCGINLSNSDPTTCINDLLIKHNESKGTNLKPISPEMYFAKVFNEIEKIYSIVQKGDLAYFYGLYYKYWLHSNAEITVTATDGQAQKVNILGIDDYGYLKVQSENGVISSVHPDGNSFDMMKGLIAPKVF